MNRLVHAGKENLMVITEEFKKSPEYQEIMQEVQQSIGLMMERMKGEQVCI